MRFAGVNGHADPQSDLAERNLSRNGRRHRFVGRRKGGSERVASSREDLTAMSADGGAHEVVVTCKSDVHGHLIALPELRTPLDVFALSPEYSEETGVCAKLLLAARCGWK